MLKSTDFAGVLLKPTDLDGAKAGLMKTIDNPFSGITDKKQSLKEATLNKQKLKDNSSWSAVKADTSNKNLMTLGSQTERKD